MIKLEYLITGTGCCGTVYAALLFNQIGISCGHEAIFDYRGISHAKACLNGLKPFENSEVLKRAIQTHDIQISMETIVAESSFMAVPFLKHEMLKDTIIFHLVRHPRLTIQALCNHHDNFTGSEPKSPWEEFIYSHMPELKGKLSQYERGALFYIKWNELIEESKPQFFCRLDDIDEHVYGIFGKKYSGLNKTTNSFKRENVAQFSYDLIESNEIRIMLEHKTIEYNFNL